MRVLIILGGKSTKNNVDSASTLKRRSKCNLGFLDAVVLKQNLIEHSGNGK